MKIGKKSGITAGGYKCQWCPLRFATLKGLIRHERGAH